MKTGIYCVALGVALLLAPTASAQFDVNGDYTVSGSVGAGTATPAQKIHLYQGTGVSTRFRMENGEGSADFFTNDNAFWAIVGGQQRLNILANGLVGMGTTAPVSKLHLLQGGTGGAALTIENGEGSVVVKSDNGDMQLQAGGGVVLTVGFDGNVIAEGEMSVSVLEIRGSGADLAEGFKINNPKSEIEAGMVVSICPDNPGELKLSTQPYERTVAGIISGGGDMHVGLQLGHADEVRSGELHPVALTGRVWCHVDATEHAIQPGDLLTTSATPGHAMKVTDYGRAQGAIIGKAMTPLGSGKGLVLVLVSLQ